MQVIRTKNPIEDAAQAVANKIRSQLKVHKTVLWLLSGGSGSKVALRVAELLHNCQLDNLLVSMSDERYGPVGHVNENWQQLLDAGLSLPGAQLYRPLTGADRTTTTKQFETWLAESLNRADYKIAIFGIGSDGHTAGIKPGSSAATSNKLAADFDGEDFQRLTMTFPAIRALDEVVMQASGLDKLPVLRRLQQPDQDLVEFPAAILQLNSNVSLYSDLPVVKQ